MWRSYMHYDLKYSEGNVINAKLGRAVKQSLFNAFVQNLSAIKASA